MSGRRALITSKLHRVILRWRACGVASMKCSGGKVRRYASAALAYSIRTREIGFSWDIRILLTGLWNWGKCNFLRNSREDGLISFLIAVTSTGFGSKPVTASGQEHPPVVAQPVTV